MNDARVWIRKYANTPYWTFVVSDSRLFVGQLDYVCGARPQLRGLLIGRVEIEIVTCLWTVSRAKVSIPLVSRAISELFYNKY